VQLDNFAHVKNGLIRFRADYIGPIGGGDMGIDDVLLMDREEYDISVKELRRPESRCEPTNLERVRVRVQNTGSEDIFNFEMSHQITFYPYDSLPITFPVVRESITTQIVPTAYYTFQFNERLDMTRPGKYVFKI